MKNHLSEISSQEKNRILEMHKKSTQRHYLVEDTETTTQVKSKLIELKPGMIGKGFMQDTAEGKTYKVIKSTDLPCGITEVQFKRNEEQFTSNNKTFEYGYYKPSEQNDDYPNKIGFRRLGEGVKDADPCKNFESFGDFGNLDFS